MSAIKSTKNLVIGQKDLNRKHFLYTRKGHKKINLKNRNKLKLTPNQIIDLRSKM